MIAIIILQKPTKFFPKSPTVSLVFLSVLLKSHFYEFMIIGFEKVKPYSFSLDFMFLTGFISLSLEDFVLLAKIYILDVFLSISSSP